MANIAEYFKSVGSGIKSLVLGMGVTGKEFVTPKITEQYPENRDTQIGRASCRERVLDRG